MHLCTTSYGPSAGYYLVPSSTASRRTTTDKCHASLHAWWNQGLKYLFFNTAQYWLGLRMHQEYVILFSGIASKCVKLILKMSKYFQPISDYPQHERIKRYWNNTHSNLTEGFNWTAMTHVRTTHSFTCTIGSKNAHVLYFGTFHDCMYL